MSNKYHTACNFRNSRAAKKMAANYRKTFGLGLDGKPRRYGKRNKMTKTQTNIANMLRKAGRKVAVIDTAELLHCPFCGSYSAQTTRETPTAFIIVACNACGAQGPDRNNEQDAIQAWNLRVVKNAQ